MASGTITIELSDQDRRRIDALCKAMCPTGTVAVVVYVETVGFTDGVHLFSSVDDAESWMLQEIRQHGGEQSHLTPDEFQKRLKPNEDFWIVDVHDELAEAMMKERIRRAEARLRELLRECKEQLRDWLCDVDMNTDPRLSWYDAHICKSNVTDTNTILAKIDGELGQ